MRAVKLCTNKKLQLTCIMVVVVVVVVVIADISEIASVKITYLFWLVGIGQEQMWQTCVSGCS